MIPVELVRLESRMIAAVRRRTTIAQVPRVIGSALDLVWPVVRTQSLGPGRNVAIYRHLGGGAVEMDCGVEVVRRFEADGEVLCVETPAGLAARAVHTGPYDRMGTTYDVVCDWVKQQAGYQRLATNMEVYGHWVEDPAKLVTELFLFVRER